MSDIHSILECNTKNDYVWTYDTILHDLFEKNAPEYQCTSKSRHNVPWHNTAVHDAKHLHRKLERHWKNTRLETDKEVYRTQCKVIRDELVKAKSDYFNKLSEADNQNNVYSIVNGLLFGPTERQIPSMNQYKTFWAVCGLFYLGNCNYSQWTMPNHQYW